MAPCLCSPTHRQTKDTVSHSLQYPALLHNCRWVITALLPSSCCPGGAPVRRTCCACAKAVSFHTRPPTFRFAFLPCSWFHLLFLSYRSSAYETGADLERVCSLANLIFVSLASLTSYLLSHFDNLRLISPDLVCDTDAVSTELERRQSRSVSQSSNR